jgi:tetratricopeptide (TPR) repeat protein
MARAEPGASTDLIEQATTLFAAVGDQRRLGEALDDLAAQAHREGRHADALEHLDRAVTARDAAGDVIGVASASYRSAELLIELGRLDEAAVSLERVRSAARATMDRLLTVRASMRSAEIDARQGNTAEALGMLEQTQTGFENLGADADAAANWLIRAEAHLLGGAVEEALAASEKALESTPDVPARIGLWRVRGTALVWMGRSREGHLQLMEALDAAQSTGASVEEAMISDALATLYGDADAAGRRDAISSRLGIVRLPPFLTVH